MTMLTTPLHLTDEELLSLTHLRRPSAQVRALRAMGVPYRTRPDGTLLVGRIAAERALSAPAPVEPQRQAAANGLRWSRTA